MEKLRGNVFSMVFQDPMTSLNPTMNDGAQIAEAVRVHEPKILKSRTGWKSFGTSGACRY